MRNPEAIEVVSERPVGGDLHLKGAAEVLELFVEHVADEDGEGDEEHGHARVPHEQHEHDEHRHIVHTPQRLKASHSTANFSSFTNSNLLNCFMAAKNI